jgi:hypothetical protein
VRTAIYNLGWIGFVNSCSGAPHLGDDWKTLLRKKPLAVKKKIIDKLLKI